MSISDVLRGQELVDFEKVNSLEGVFIANKYEDDRSAQRERIMARKSSVAQQSPGSSKKIKEFSEADIEAQNI